MKQKGQKVLIICLFILAFIMIIGYGAFSSKINIKGIARANTSWNVAIESIVVNGSSAKGNMSTAIENGGLSASFESSLQYPGDTITYDVTIANKGVIDAKLDDMIFEQRNTGNGIQGENLSAEQLENNPIIYNYSEISKGEVLLADSKKTFQVTVQYNPKVDSAPSLEQTKSELTLTLSYVQNTEG